MKNRLLLLTILIFMASIMVLTAQTEPLSPQPVQEYPFLADTSALDLISPVYIPASFSCDCDKTCTAIATCEEAYFQLVDCGCTARDGDADGIPCELEACSGVSNPKPVAFDDTFTTPYQTVLTVSAGNGLLKNDKDYNGGALTAVKLTDPAHGTLLFNADGSFTYTPQSGYSGNDTFTYAANDSTANSAAAIVTITVEAAIIPDGLEVIAPAGTIINSLGNPSFEWTKSGNASKYQIYIHTSGSPANAVIYETNISASQYCSGEICVVDLTTLPNGDSYWLANGNYVIYLSVNGTVWKGPYSFSLSVPKPSVPALAGLTESTSSKPTFQWTLEGTAANAAWFHLVVVPQNGSGVALDAWVSRRDSCGTDAGITCTFKSTSELILGTSYSLYMQSWGAGGFSTAGASGWAGPLNFNAGGLPPAAPSNIQASFSAGKLTITWDNDSRAQWFNIWAGNSASTLHYDWHERNNTTPLFKRADCDETTCTAEVTGLSPAAGNYQVYILAWGPGGLSKGGLDGWGGPVAFTVGE